MSDPSRDERLKAALRENLKRRKAQARGRTRPEEDVRPSDGQPGPAGESDPVAPPRD